MQRGAAGRRDAALVSPDPPDLVVLDGLDLKNSMEKGLLEDLGAYLEKSGILDRKDFLENALEGYTFGGKLAGIPVEIRVKALAGRLSQVGEPDSWTMEDVYAIAEQYPEHTRLLSDGFYRSDGRSDEIGTRTHLLGEFCAPWYLEEYVDWDKGTCNFDSEGFRRLLQWIGEHGSDEPQTAGTGESVYYTRGYMPEDALFMEDFLDFERAAIWQVQFGEEIRLLGYPSADGRGKVYVQPVSPLGIVAEAGNREGAWAFLEYYISLACEQKDVLTTSKSQLQEQMEAWTITDRQNGDTERKSFVILDEVSEPVYGISREMAQQVMDLLKEADFSPDSRWKDDIAGIVLEEAEDFYKGNKSLDSAVAGFSLHAENPVNAQEGGGSGSFLGASRAYCFKKHLFVNMDECWDELSYVSVEGERGTERIELVNQLWGVGTAVGTDHYVGLNIEAEEEAEEYRYRYILTERDENHEKVREFPLNFLQGDIGTVLETIQSLGVDSSGAAHLLQGGRYLMVSQEGEILAEYVPEDGTVREMIPLYDGRMAFWQEGKGNLGEITLQCMDAESGKPVMLASLGNPETNIHYITLFDEGSLLYADKDGLYRSDLSGKNPELLYRWVHHGIITHGISGIQTDGEEKIMILYSDSEQLNFLCLEPTTEEVPICRITMNVWDSSMDVYQLAVAEFNRRYPSCYIELVGIGNKDRTALLTQLTAGKGPVLIDPTLANFEEMEELWEPLDDVLEQLGIMEELYLNAMEMGRINGTLYGIVGDFFLETVVAVEPDLEDWDFDTFMQRVRDTPGLEAVCDYYSSEYGPYNLYSLLNHGLEDNYFIIADEETGELHFDRDRFRQFVELADKYCRNEEGVWPGDSLLEGKTLCNALSVHKPEDIAACRKIYGEDVNYIGAPAGDGGIHEICAPNMLSIRKSATKEEKEAAAAFLAMYLSYETQARAAKDMSYNLSVRRDVLEEQVASMPTVSYLYLIGEVKIGDNMDIERDRATLEELIESARPRNGFPRELSDILWEELDQYFAGSITEDMLMEHLENRGGLYLGERN